MNDNPYESPPDFPTGEKAPNQKLLYAQYLLISVHHWTGINLLGVLLLCLWFIPIAILADLLGQRSLGILLVGLAIACALIDVFVRYRHPSPDGRLRFFSPFAGGAFLYIPIWILISGLFVTAGVLFFF